MQKLIQGWPQNLRRATNIFDRFGAYPVRRVEAGLVGVRGVMWRARFMAESSPARKDQAILTRQQRDWSEDAQLAFLMDAYNRIRDNFALPRADRADLEKMLQQ